eukprot:8215487-Pyramimonas_sp.AAC.1
MSHVNRRRGEIEVFGTEEASPVWYCVIWSPPPIAPRPHPIRLSRIPPPPPLSGPVPQPRLGGVV